MQLTGPISNTFPRPGRAFGERMPNYWRIARFPVGIGKAAFIAEMQAVFADVLRRRTLFTVAAFCRKYCRDFLL
ncbi:MAG: hypothetical protein ABSB42_03205 [Tepidisphaeraceae bacterium]